MIQYYYNGNILTMNRETPRSPHMLVAEGKILHCDPSPAPLGLDFRASDFSTIQSARKSEVEFIDLNGQTVIPGICDAHAHFLMWGLGLSHADLVPTRSEQECLDIIKEMNQNLEPGDWVLGRGWTHNLWENPKLPTRDSLDALFPDNPVYLSSKCGHLAWVNSKALAMAGITDATPDPYGGEMERDTGRLTGILKELAMDPVAELRREPSEKDWRKALAMAQHEAHRLGITSMQTPEDITTWGYLQKFHAEDLLTMRVNFWIPVAQLDAMLDGHTRHGLGDDRLRISAIKIFADGSLGGRTSLMYEDHENEPGNRGVEVTSVEDITEATLRANRAGLSMAIHAIGDLAVGNVITAYEKAAEELGTDGDTTNNPVLRNRIEHLQIFHDRDLDRIKKLKPIASIQPIHLCADMHPADMYWGSRAKNAYACRTAADAGCLLVFGSDVPVESCNPFWGMYAAITRNDIEGKPGDGWYPQECISLQETLEAYTINTAIASGQQDRLGSLETGKYADFVILEQDPHSQSSEQLRDTLPVATYINGECVFATDFWKAIP